MVRLKLFFSIILLTVCLLMPLYAQDKETLAVLDFQTEAISSLEMSVIVEFLSSELFNTDKYIVIDVSQRQTILNEVAFSNSGCTDDSCALEIGKLLSAELIVTGKLSKVGSRYLMSTKMLETETSRTVGTANGKYNDLDELIDGLEEIAVALAGQERDESVAAADEPVDEAVATTETTTESEEPVNIEETETTTIDSSPVEETVASGVASEEPEAVSSTVTADFNIPAFIASSAGAVGFSVSGLFRSMAFVDKLNAEAAYDIYMSSTYDPGALYSGTSDGSYEQYFNDYTRDTGINYITSAVGGVSSPAAFYLGDTSMSFGGRLAYGLGVFAFAAGNLMSSMSVNYAFESSAAYDTYLSASGSSIDSLWQVYQENYGNYQAFQYASLGLWGAGGLLSIGSWFIPGEQTPAVSGTLEKIILTAGYLFLAGGNFTSSMAVNSRFSAEDAYADYMSAGADAASALYQTYADYQHTSELLTYASYGLWGAGAAAIITAIFLPPADTAGPAVASSNFMIRPALTGFGVEVELKLK